MKNGDKKNKQGGP